MKTVIITGANGNLGSAVTTKFLDAGYAVVATVANDSMKNDMPVHKNLHVEVVNLINESEATLFVENAIQKYQQVHAALMLVGGFAMGNIASTSTADLEKQFSLNFNTAYNITRPLLQHMLQKETGRLIYIGARPALQAADGKNLVAYGLSKSLLFTLSNYINEEAKGKNVTATVIVPSTLDTVLNRKSMPEINPANWVKPEQLADILEFAVSDKSSTLREPILKVYNNA